MKMAMKEREGASVWEMKPTTKNKIFHLLRGSSDTRVTQVTCPSVLGLRAPLIRQSSVRRISVPRNQTTDP